MDRNKKLLTVLSVLTLSAMSVGTVFAANSLVQMDVKKASNDTIDFTLYTSQQNNGTPIVRKKSDNKYVVLVPGISSSAISTPDFHAVKDLITNVDVKTVNDTSDGYAKMTVITKKPLNIRTKTITSSPVTPEQAEYRSLLAVANTPKANSINPVKNISSSTPTSKSNNVAKATSQPQNIAPIKTNDINTKKLEILSQNEVEKISKKVDKTTTTPKSTVNTTKKETKPEVKTPQSFAQELHNDIIENKEIKNETLPVLDTETLNTNENIPTQTKVSLGVKIKNKIEDVILPMIPVQLPAPLAMVIIPLLALIFMFKLIKASIEKSRDLRAAFVDKVKNNSKITKRYADITNDDSLSWREKYQKYNDAVQNPEKYDKERLERAKQAKYAFIKNNPVDEKRENLEKMINPITEQTNNLIVSEDDIIPEKMVKLKGFAKKPTLKAISRAQFNNELENSNTSSSAKVTKNIDLETSSSLNASKRHLKEANLDVFDVEEKPKSIKDLKRLEELRKNDYEMSSLEEFFAMPEKISEENQIKMISTPVEKRSTEEISKNLSNLEKTIRVPRPYQSSNGINLSKAFENPFNKNSEIKMISTPKKEISTQGLSVNSKVDIDENHGFMVVSMNGKSALVGRANDEITVLKEFDSIITKPIQVRKDKDNVYLVKTEGFKSLVEINDTKMGVLIEL